MIRKISEKLKRLAEDKRPADGIQAPLPSIFSDTETDDWKKRRDKRRKCDFELAPNVREIAAALKKNMTKSATSLTNFMMSHSSELADAVHYLKQLHAAGEELYTKIDENEWEETYSRYDKNVQQEVEHWIDQGSVDVHQIADFAIDNMNRYGTEPQFVLEAIERTYNLAKRNKVVASFSSGAKTGADSTIPTPGEYDPGTGDGKVYPGVYGRDSEWRERKKQTDTDVMRETKQEKAINDNTDPDSATGKGNKFQGPYGRDSEWREKKVSYYRKKLAERSKN
jgi:hypothetical protein